MVDRFNKMGSYQTNDRHPMLTSESFRFFGKMARVDLWIAFPQNYISLVECSKKLELNPFVRYFGNPLRRHENET